jgi:hypothetical protein
MVDEYVLGFDVSMDDVLLVQVTDSLADLSEDSQEISFGESLGLTYEGEETPPGRVLEDQVDSVAGEEVSVESDDTAEFEVLMNEDLLLDVLDLLLQVLHFDFDLVTLTILIAYLRPVFFEMPRRTEANEPEPRLPPSEKMKSFRQSIFSSASLSF